VPSGRASFPFRHGSGDICIVLVSSPFNVKGAEARDTSRWSALPTGRENPPNWGFRLYGSARIA